MESRHQTNYRQTQNPKPHIHTTQRQIKTSFYTLIQSKNSQLSLGWTGLMLAAVVTDVGGADTSGGAEAESKVSHFVVTTTGPDVECLDGCGGCCCCWCICIGRWATECLGCCSCWTSGGAAGGGLCPLDCRFCWCCIGIWSPSLSGVEFFIFNISRVSTYFCTLLTFNKTSFDHQEI